jgi:hypothetical protein
MPWIIDYPLVQEQMRQGGFKSLYYNSGAFGFVDASNVKTIGWIGLGDSTLKPAAREVARSVPAPFEENLARLCTQVWEKSIGGKAWIMPMSHWAYELDFGSHDWMPDALDAIGIDAGLLQDRTNGAATERRWRISIIRAEIAGDARFERFRDRVSRSIGAVHDSPSQAALVDDER